MHLLGRVDAEHSSELLCTDSPDFSNLTAQKNTEDSKTRSLSSVINFKRFSSLKKLIADDCLRVTINKESSKTNKETGELDH